MNYTTLLLLVFPLTIVCAPAFAQEASVSISTDSESYVYGDTIVISGNVGIVIPNTPILIQIFYGNNAIDFAQETVAEDGGFSTTFRAQGPLWGKDGTYTIRVAYGVDNISEIGINFFGDVDLSATDLEKYDVNLPDGGTFDVGYMIKGADILSMEIIPENFSIVIEISTNTNGYIFLQLPNEQIISKNMNGSDEQFIILVYETNDAADIGVETSYEEISSNDNFRSIKIPFNNGDKKIEVIGTWAIPEFGTIAGLVLAVAIISIIVLSAKTRLNIIPKF